MKPTAFVVIAEVAIIFVIVMWIANVAWPWLAAILTANGVKGL